MTTLLTIGILLTAIITIIAVINKVPEQKPLIYDAE
jgi:hypothetical protein